MKKKFIKSFQQIKRFNCSKLLSNKKYVISSIVLIGLLIVFISYSFAALTPTPSITVPSTTLSYPNKEEGAWQYTKSAHWISKGKARINIKVDTLKKSKFDYTDVILVLDTSGSMLGTKLTQVQNDVNELINVTIPKGNKIALITFNDSATVVNDFTNDTTLLQESINNLTVSGETNYYQALIKVDDILSTYNKESNRDCVVLFLTDGLPTIDTPNEVGEYKYLKSKYSYLDINGIQYELGDTVLTGIKNITDTQYLANKGNLNEFLYKASLSTAVYDKFTLTDYVDTNYFNLNNVTDINTTFGEATIQNNKVIWDLSGLRSGLDASLTIDINLNNDLENVGGIYSTHSKTDVNYKIDKTSTTETTTKSTVLKDNYLVNYEANAPASCVPSNVPNSKKYFVYDTVQIDGNVPTCSGYQFKGWEIITSGVKKVTDTTFVMPEKNVILRAIWTKLNVTKSMDGTVHRGQTLYNLLANKSVGVDTDESFTELNPTFSDAIYTRKGTENDEYPVYYYRGNIDNNNVLFAGFCWKMVRTTSTGGVKLVYNGPYEKYASSSPIIQTEYINISNDATYPFTYDTSTNKWISTNKTHSKTGTISFSVAEKGTYTLSYSVSSEANCDKAYFYKDGTQIGVDSGTNTGTISLGELTSSNVIQVKYTKDGSVSSGSDSVTFSLDKPSGKLIKNCDNTGEDALISTSKFNASYYSLSDVGYMYGVRYNTNLQMFPDVEVLDRLYASSTNYYYGTSISYSNGTYTLLNAEPKMWGPNYSNLVGYYTCRNYGTTCSTAYYVAAGEYSTQFAVVLSAGATSPTRQTITLGKGVRANSNGTYTLTNTVTLKKSDWYENYSNYEGYYVCRDLTSKTCANKNRIMNTMDFAIRYDDTFGYVYGNDVTWDGTKYTLKDTFTSTGWDTDVATIAKKYHYTCLNTTGQCTEVYYLTDFSEDQINGIHHLTLSSGKNIEDAKNEMFTNTNDSLIKQTIDSWYKENLISYTDKLEDTPWCNDRTLSTGPLVGKDEDSGTNFYTKFMGYYRESTSKIPSIECPNLSRDGFTVSKVSGGNGALTYPIGLLTVDEMMLAKAVTSNSYLRMSTNYWLMSPSNQIYEQNDGYYSTPSSQYQYISSSLVNNSYGVRPAISLAPGTVYFDGDGSFTNPYVIDEQ